MSKRYKVVRDATGDWGILDTMAMNFPVIEPFAPYGFTDGKAHLWLHEIYGHAVKLNTHEWDRDDFHWEEYAPRGKR